MKIVYNNSSIINGNYSKKNSNIEFFNIVIDEKRYNCKFTTHKKEKIFQVLKNTRNLERKTG